MARRQSSPDAFPTEHRQEEMASPEPYEWYRGLIENLNDVLYVVDENGLITYISPSVEPLSGYPAAELIGRSFLDFLHPEDVQSVMESFQRTIGQQPEPGECRVLTKSGDVRWVRSSARPVVRKGQVSGVQGVMTDITEHKLSEEALHKVHAELELRVQERTADLAAADEALRLAQFSLDHSADAVFWIGRDGHFRYVNDAAYRFLQYTREELLALTISDVAPELSQEVWHTRWETIKRQGSLTFESRYRTKNGDLFPVEIAANYLQFAGKEYNCAFVRDITERKRAEDRVRQQLVRLNLLHQITRAIGERQDLLSIFRVVLGSLEEGLPIAFGCLCLFDATRDALTVTVVGRHSAGFAATLGMQEQSVIPVDQNGLRTCVRGQTVYEPDTARVHASIPQRFAQAGLSSLAAAPLSVEGRVVGVLLTARQTAHGFSSGECEFLRQLSEHVAIAAHQAQLYTELQHAYEDLRQTQQTVLQQERLRALGQMASGIAHDINNAISPVALYTEALLESEPHISPRGREYLTTIQQAIEDVAHTVGRMREFYREREAHAASLALNLNRLVPQVVELTRAKWRDLSQQQGSTIRVKLALQDDLPLIVGVESGIRDALTNLIFNAVDAMPQGGTLTIGTRATSMVAVLEVSDTGVGMDDETRQKCIEPFFSTKGERGIGLGLAMVYGMIQRHSGEVEIESRLGQGTTVRLSFPFPQTMLDEEESAEKGQVSVLPVRILLVDDDPLIRKSLKHLLEADGHAVTVADGGEAGVAMFGAARQRGEPFEVVITDLGMPQLDGREVARQVKQAAPTTPVFLLTGWGQRLQVEEERPRHVDRVFSKPPKMQLLREALQTVRTGEDPEHGSV